MFDISPAASGLLTKSKMKIVSSLSEEIRNGNSFLSYLGYMKTATAGRRLESLYLPISRQTLAYRGRRIIL